MGVDVVVHVAVLAVASATLVGAVVGRRRMPAGDWVVVAALGMLGWGLHTAWFAVDGLHRAQVLWLPTVAVTVGAMAVVALRTADPAWSPPRWTPALVLLEPTIFVALSALGGPDLVVRRTPDSVDYGPLFALHTVYCFVMLMVTVLGFARRSADRDAVVRWQSAVIRAGAVGCLVAEALRLSATDVVASLALAAYVLLGLLGGARLAPAATRVLDELGAAVLVVDAEHRLVEWNQPAERLCRLQGAPAEAGLRVERVLGAPLPVRARASQTPLEQVVVADGTRLRGHSRPVSLASGADGWIVVLRPAAP